MIVLLTDYGYQGPYVGQLKAKILQLAETANVIDLMHDLPAFNIEAAATLIPAITNNFPDNTIFVCIVDPCVGSERKPILKKVASNYYIGPDNGIFNQLRTLCSEITSWEITWQPENLSNSFHGRDLFIPIACQLHNKTLNFETCLTEFPQNSNTENLSIQPQIIYFDSFGNAITSIEDNDVSKRFCLEVGKHKISYARVFSEVPIGDHFWYVNSMGLLEIACNQANARQNLTLTVGQTVAISERVE